MTWIKRTIRLLLLLAFVLSYTGAAAQSFVSKQVRIGMFSSTPLEDIKAVSDKGTAVIVAKTREVLVQLAVKTLDFDRKLMQEHFNENYIESDKYPLARFKGNLDQPVDLTRDGDYHVSVTGILSLHGTDKKRTIPCNISVRNGVVIVESQFQVACTDHHIKIPKLVFAKIAESINVKLNGQFSQVK